MTHGHELYKGRNVGVRGWAGWSGVKGGKWDNCNSIINKYILKKEYTILNITPPQKEMLSYTSETHTI